MPIFHPEGYCQGLSGRNGNLTYETTDNGTIFFNFKMPADPNTPAQQTVRNDFRKASQTFESLPKAKVDAWNYEAAKRKKRNANGQMRKQSGLAYFVQLSTKFLLVSPSGTIPQDPPTSEFLGDVPVITVTAGSGKLTYNANVPNSVGVVTELVYERLANGNRKPGKKYKTGAYFAFVLGTLSKDVTVPPGYYAAGYRFVKVATGQATPVQPLPVGQVTMAIAKKAA
ncbi:MAG: hypothetical protein JST30_03975 [Armatimonadetes bacterium]|nr:hypothetical protein [Armatimonadota bacterium]